MDLLDSHLPLDRSGTDEVWPLAQSHRVEVDFPFNSTKVYVYYFFHLVRLSSNYKPFSSTQPPFQSEPKPNNASFALVANPEKSV